ncbi:hypothetical protein M404DRAFT_26401 [Pisolithus tinctorius Marx 270]|uniref:Uncharacterized protein n=1 Tax=Pisolithus tinctorius Marx 270 TaxID=870435 RepID=A0A0C3NTG2_PISTI|nr:hypothetical protein M404DRAFT_26401 [Pisolithus tinctorius Marx 270]
MRLLRKGFRSERVRTSMEDYYEPRSDQGSGLGKQQQPTKSFPGPPVHDSLTTGIQEPMELLDCTWHEQMPVAASAGHTQPPSSPEEMANEGPSTDYIKKAADTLCFEETPELEQVEPVEEPPMTKVPIEFKLKRSKS